LNQADHDRAAKRGGGRPHVSIGAPSADDLARFVEPASDETPETIYEQRWALTVLDVAMQRLQQLSETAGELAQFAALRPFLTGEETASYAEAPAPSRRPKAPSGCLSTACGADSAVPARNPGRHRVRPGGR